MSQATTSHSIVCCETLKDFKLDLGEKEKNATTELKTK